MNKKGAISDSDKTMFWTFFVLPALILIMSLLIFVIPGLIDAQARISPNLQQQIHIKTLLNSHHCFAYQEPSSGRIMSGYVDLQKINEDVLHNCLKLERKDELGVFVQLHKEILTSRPFIELESKNALNRASSRSTEHVVPVIIMENEKEIEGLLLFKFY